MFFYTFLPKLFNMSLTASVAIVLVLLLRLLLKKAPKVISYALWGIVLFRLICPVSIESGFSLFGLLDAPVAESGTMASRIEYVPDDIVHTAYPDIVMPVPGFDDAIHLTLPQGEEQLRADPLETPMAIATYVWMTGVIGMGIYAAVSYKRLRRKLITASPLRENIYLVDDITSPFVMGILKPKIYLPSSVEEQEQSYILMHEQHHIRRLDHIIKALAFVVLCIHWFNPLVWIAFIFAGRDMEMSCDEAVIKKMGDGILADYTASLLSFATGKHIIAGTPLAFGEGDTKGRIRNLANWKKPALGIIVVAVVACGVFALCLLTNPKQKRIDSTLLDDVEQYQTGYIGDASKVSEIAQFDSYPEDFRYSSIEFKTQTKVEAYDLDTAINRAILEHFSDENPDGLIHVESHVLLANEAMSGTPVVGEDTCIKKETVYLLVLYETYGSYGGTLEPVGGSYIPTAITFVVFDSGEYALGDYWEPRDGRYYAEDIRNKFPDAAADDALNDQAYIEDLQTQNYSKALTYLHSVGSLDMTIENLLDTILDSPTASSNPSDYTQAHKAECQELLGYGKYTLQYCFSEFLQGGQTDLRGQIMAFICQNIMLTWGEGYAIDQDPVTGQDWFDAFRRSAESLDGQYSDEDMEKHYPGSWLLLRMINE